MPKPDNASQNKSTDSHNIKPERLAKVMARAGLCSRREAESWIIAGRVQLNGKLQISPGINVSPADIIVVDNKPIATRERTRLWLYHKPRGLVTTHRDPQGRPTLFASLPDNLPRVISVGRLDINTEGLILLTNDGGLARVLELPETGWLRRYRVRVFGQLQAESLEKLAKGVTLEGIHYEPVEVSIDQSKKNRSWLTIGLREGKNREIKKLLQSLDLQVTRLIRVSYGPFQLGELDKGEIREIRSKQLREQLGTRLSDKARVDFSAPSATNGITGKTARHPKKSPVRSKNAHYRR